MILKIWCRSSFRKLWSLLVNDPKFTAPNLQHWLGCASWAELYPDATVYVAPAAEGECLVEKLDLNLNSKVEILDEQGSLFDGQLAYSLLKGIFIILINIILSKFTSFRLVS